MSSFFRGGEREETIDRLYDTNRKYFFQGLGLRIFYLGVNKPLPFPRSTGNTSFAVVLTETNWTKVIPRFNACGKKKEKKGNKLEMDGTEIIIKVSR